MKKITINYSLKLEKLLKKVLIVLILVTVGLYVGSHWPNQTKIVLETFVRYFNQAISMLKKIMDSFDELIRIILFLQSIKKNSYSNKSQL